MVRVILLEAFSSVSFGALFMAESLIPFQYASRVEAGRNYSKEVLSAALPLETCVSWQS